jgi:ABC-2 type transport system permease protein
MLAIRLRAQILKELLCLWRDPKSRFVLVGPPMIQLLVFSFAASLELRNVELGVFNRDSGVWSVELQSRLAEASFIKGILPLHQREDIQARIDRRDIMAAIEIPETFSRDVESGRRAEVQVILDGRRANSTQILQGYLERIMRELPLKPGVRPPPETVSVRHWFNPNLTDRWFTVPGLGGILVMFVTLLVTSLSIARERELGTFDQLLVSPSTPMEIIVAKMVPAMIMGLLLGSIMAGAAIFLFGIPFTGHFLLLQASLLLFILSIVGIGLMISSVCSTQQQAILGTFSIAVPAVLVSGFATPVENMPLVLQWVSEGIPLKHYLIILHGCFLKAMPASAILEHAWPLAIIALVTLSGATFFVRSRLQ